MLGHIATVYLESRYTFSDDAAELVHAIAINPHCWPRQTDCANDHACLIQDRCSGTANTFIKPLVVNGVTAFDDLGELICCWTKTWRNGKCLSLVPQKKRGRLYPEPYCELVREFRWVDRPSRVHWGPPARDTRRGLLARTPSMGGLTSELDKRLQDGPRALPNSRPRAGQSWTPVWAPEKIVCARPVARIPKRRAFAACVMPIPCRCQGGRRRQ